MEEPNSLMTPDEASRFLGMSKSTLYKYTHLGTIPFIKVSHKCIRFSRDELDQWIRERRRGEWFQK